MLRIICICLFLFLLCTRAVWGAERQPNVLFIMSDDLNGATSGLGHPECKTPNLDEFAKTGVSFTKAFCQFPLCGPSRASIMSGQSLLGEHHMWKKSKLWEEAIRVPLIISVPGGKQGVKCDHTVELVDLYPTLAELAGLPADAKAQGQSLVGLLNDPQTSLPKDDAFIQVAAGYGLRSDKWAYMWYPTSKKHKQEGAMLYDMQQDPSQYHNLADHPEHASIKKQLHERLMKRIETASP